MFVDKVEISIKAGNGGNGAVTFHREKYVNAGGPDGGDGGKGSDIVFVADDNLSTLIDFRYKRKYIAPDGEPGGAKRCSGSTAICRLYLPAAWPPIPSCAKRFQSGSAHCLRNRPFLQTTRLELLFWLLWRCSLQREEEAYAAISEGNSFTAEHIYSFPNGGGPRPAKPFCSGRNFQFYGSLSFRAPIFILER